MMLPAVGVDGSVNKAVGGRRGLSSPSGWCQRRGIGVFSRILASLLCRLSLRGRKCLEQIW